MDTLTTLINIALIWSIAAATPVPNFVLTVQTAAGNSRRLGLATVGGIVTGTLIWGLAGFFGISALFAAAPWLYASLKVAGGLYLIYLGARLMVNSVRRPAPTNTQMAAPAPIPTRSSLGAAWRLGLLTNLSNPKTAAFVTSLFATTMPAEPEMSLGLSAAAVMTGVSLLWYGAVAWVFASPLAAGCYGRAAKFIERKTPITAADLLNDRVIPLFDEHDIPLLRVLTDRGTEYCGNPERHEYELYLAIEDIDHSRTKTKSPQTNGICERFHKTILDEFYRVAFRKKIYRSIAELQTDLDEWMRGYNEVRTHQGRWC